MKQAKQRVIAIDYFRGIFILVVVLNHAAAFSMPFAYLAGASGLWTSAAEMFMLLSGITLGIIRAGAIKSDFWNTSKKIWRRAGLIYLLDVIVIFLSLTMALFMLSHHLPNGFLGSLPQKTGLSLLVSVLGLNYSIGWASFLGYFTVLLAVSPFLLYGLRTRFWYIVPAASAGLFLLNSSQLSAPGVLGSYAIWQLYFVLGLSLGRFRLEILNRYFSLKRAVRTGFSAFIYAATFITLLVSVFLDFRLWPQVGSLVASGLLPLKVQNAYTHLLNHKPMLDLLFNDVRTGVLRPAVTLLFLAAVYLLYQRYKAFLLRRTGNFINALGRDTLWIFVAQALAIPLLGLIPLPRDLAFNFMLTAILIYMMWLVTKRRAMAAWLGQYVASLRRDFYEAKYAAVYRQQS